MEVRLLGTVEVVSDGQALELGAKKQRGLLAMLALEVNRPVSVDRLIDGLWGEAPPASAAKLVQVYVSGLRKALAGSGAEIVTRGRGYELHCDAQAVDVMRLERLLDGHNGSAREALALWRGPSLIDVADEPFAAAEIGRLEELRLRAREAAIEADLAGGQHDAVLAELSGLVADHPLREHLQALRMLALYRSGRQAEALDAYRETRVRLVEQIGAEPGPELQRLHQAILRHDPAIAGAARRVAPAERKRRRGMALAGAALAVIAAGIVVLTTRDHAATLAEDSIGLIDARGAISDVYPAGRQPSAVAAGGASLWIANALDHTVTRLDRERGRSTAIDVGETPIALAIGAGSVWAGAGRAVSQIAPASNTVVQRFPVDGEPAGIAVGAGAVWVALPLEGEIARISLTGDPHPRPVPLGGAPDAIAVDAGDVWVADRDFARVWRIDPRSLLPTATVNVGNGPSALAAGAGAIWVANRPDGTVSRIDPRTAHVTATTTIGGEAGAMAAAGDGLWVADPAGGELVRLDATGRVTERIKTTTSPSALAADGGSVWAAAEAGPLSHHGGTLRVEAAPCVYDDNPAMCADPGFTHSSEYATLTLAYDGLTGYRRAEHGAGDQLVGALATGVPAPSRDGLRYTFTLRPGLRYSDGRPVRAGDFRASLTRALRLSGHDNGSIFSAIAGVPACLRIPDSCDLSRGISADDSARTITIRLSRPDPELARKLAGPFASVVPADTPVTARQTGIPGTGPYRVAAIGADGSVKLVRNRYFGGRPAGDRPAGFADAIVITRESELGARLAAVEADDADIATLEADGGQLPSGLVAGLVTSHAGHVSEAPQLALDMMLFNVRTPPFDDVRVRRALNFAIDRARLARFYGGPVAASPACSPLPARLPSAAMRCPYTRAPNSAGTWSAPDLPAARRLVAASGTGGMRVQVLVGDDKPRVGAYIAGVLHRLGYHASTRVLPTGPEFYGALPRSQIGWFGWTADYPTPTTFFDPWFTCGLSSPTPQLSAPCDPALDGAVRTALRAGGVATAWRPAERRLEELALSLPFVTRRNVVLSSRRTGNVELHPLWGPLLELAWVR